MKYLVLDTCIWLNLLDDSNERNNPINSIEIWVENEDIKLLVPETLIKEWENNRTLKAERLKKEWDEFEIKAIAIFGNDIVRGKISGGTIDYFVDDQLKRAESLLKNRSIRIPITNDHRVLATQMALDKKRPFHNTSENRFLLFPMLFIRKAVMCILCKSLRIIKRLKFIVLRKTGLSYLLLWLKLGFNPKHLDEVTIEREDWRI